jgi:CheY-like chemotaxis protein
VTNRTLVIVDDHDEFRRFARTLLESDGFDVTGEAADGESALSAIAELQPDAVLLDVQLPAMDGFEVARRLAATAEAPAVVLTSTREPADYGLRLTEAPVTGFLPKRELSGAALAAMLDSASS